jgi:hypothetical protein
MLENRYRSFLPLSVTNANRSFASLTSPIGLPSVNKPNKLTGEQALAIQDLLRTVQGKMNLFLSLPIDAELCDFSGCAGLARLPVFPA